MDNILKSINNEAVLVKLNTCGTLINVALKSSAYFKWHIIKSKNQF